MMELFKVGGFCPETNYLFMGTPFCLYVFISPFKLYTYR